MYFKKQRKKAAIIRLSTANSFELIHYQDKHIALLIPFDRIQRFHTNKKPGRVWRLFPASL